MTEALIVRGGKRLRGAVRIPGSKNAATKMMVASLLTEEPCTIENIPLSADVDITRELCEAIGARIELDAEDRRLTIQTRTISNPRVTKLTRRNRIPILALGPLLHRAGVAEVPVLGGCPIGHRPINFHIEALRRMGAKIERKPESYAATAQRLHGTALSLPYPSVGATENILLAATRAEGTTRIANAAMEPEIMNLIALLQAMGARIETDPLQRRIVVEGVARLHGASFGVMPDRNVAVSLAITGLVTEGEIRLHGLTVPRPFSGSAPSEYLAPFLETVRTIGGGLTLEKGELIATGRKPYAPAEIETAPHPAFMTDWQQPTLVLLTQAEGKSIIHETVYEDRFGYTKDLMRMGARITVSPACPAERPCRYQGEMFPHTAEVVGPTPLKSTDIHIPDIRAGMAHLIAALIAEGESRITGIEHLDRGYEKLDEQLRGLGADIQRVNVK